MHSDVLKDDFPCNPLCLILVLLLHINPEGRWLSLSPGLRSWAASNSQGILMKVYGRIHWTYALELLRGEESRNNVLSSVHWRGCDISFCQKQGYVCVCVICHVYVCKLLGIHAYIDVHCIHTCCFLIWLQYIDNLYNYCYHLYYCWWVVSSIMTVSVFDCDSKRFFCLFVFI